MIKEGKLFNIDLAIKFGSKEIIIYRKGFGIVAKQPALIAYEDGKFKAFGKAAQNLKLQQVKGVEVYEPIVNSAVEDERKAILLLDKLLKDVINDRILITKISALVAVPCALNQRQLLLLKKVLNSAGIGKVTFVQNSVCAYAHMDMDPFSHIMVVDIGKYLTDISVLNEFTFDFGRMFFIGGADMDKSITTFIEDNYNVKVSDAVSEEIKNEIDKGNGKHDAITHYMNKYGFVPPWVVTKILSLGSISKFYGLMKQQDRQEISKQFHINDRILKNILGNLTSVRNIAAHDDRLYTYRSTFYIRLDKTKKSPDKALHTNMYIIIKSLELLLENEQVIEMNSLITKELDTLKDNLTSITIDEVLKVMGFDSDYYIV